MLVNDFFHSSVDFWRCAALFNQPLRCSLLHVNICEISAVQLQNYFMGPLRAALTTSDNHCAVRHLSHRNKHGYK